MQASSFILQPQRGHDPRGRGDIAIVTIERPKARNAVNPDTAVALTDGTPRT